MHRAAKQQATLAVNKYESEKEMSKHIKGYFDANFGPNWHCIVGKGFATHATYEAKTYIFLDCPPHTVLLYKMG